MARSRANKSRVAARRGRGRHARNVRKRRARLALKDPYMTRGDSYLRDQDLKGMKRWQP